MTWPLTPEKAKYPSLVTSKNFIKKYGKNLKPQFENILKAILCFSPNIAQKLKVQFNGKRKKALGAFFDFYEKQQTTVVSGFGIGAPAAVICLEHLNSFGIKYIFSLGWAGAFSENLSLGDSIFIEKAFRDEGTSYHYNPKKKSHILVKHSCQKVFKQNFAKSVTSWTTDAPYRETEYEFKKWKKNKADCVEMEASALMTLGKYYGLSVFCFAVISDLIEKDKTWNMDFCNKRAYQNFYDNLKILLNTSSF